MVDVSCSSNSLSVNEDVDVETEGNAEGNRNWYDQMKRAFQVKIVYIVYQSITKS